MSGMPRQPGSLDSQQPDAPHLPAGVTGRGTMAAPHVMAQLVVVVVVALPTVLAISCTAPFEAVGGKWCIYSTITYPAVIHERPAARNECKNKGGDLVILDDHEKFRAISRHIHSKSTKETVRYPYWVSGARESGVWKWHNGTPMNLRSHLWSPFEPNPGASSQDIRYVQLEVQGPRNRHYLVTELATGHAPGYICES